MDARFEEWFYKLVQELEASLDTTLDYDEVRMFIEISDKVHVLYLKRCVLKPDTSVPPLH